MTKEQLKHCFEQKRPKIRQACSALSKDELKKDDGLDKLIAKLRELYGVSNKQATFSAYEKFEQHLVHMKSLRLFSGLKA